MKPVLSLALDVVFVVAFTFAGRISHDEAITPAGVAQTAWPFLVGLLLGWLVTRSWKRTLTMTAALGIWACTVFGGMAIRLLTGSGAQVAFLIVALVVLGFLLIGWRLIAFLIVQSRRRKRKALRTGEHVDML